MDSNNTEHVFGNNDLEIQTLVSYGLEFLNGAALTRKKPEDWYTWKVEFGEWMKVYIGHSPDELKEEGLESPYVRNGGLDSAFVGSTQITETSYWAIIYLIRMSICDSELETKLEKEPTWTIVQKLEYIQSYLFPNPLIELQQASVRYLLLGEDSSATIFEKLRQLQICFDRTVILHDGLFPDLQRQFVQCLCTVVHQHPLFIGRSADYFEWSKSATDQEIDYTITLDDVRSVLEGFSLQQCSNEESVGSKRKQDPVDVPEVTLPSKKPHIE